MNIFGSFTFGSLIKTFLPGFVWLIAVVVLVADIAVLLGWHPDIWGYLTSKDQAATLILAFPLSILLGLLSNIVVFMGLNDRWVRHPVRTAEPGLFAVHERLSAHIREQCWVGLAWTDDAIRPNFDFWTDTEIVLLERVGVEKLSYVREQYWYHLEFQLNLLISLIAIYVTCSLSLFLNVETGHGPLALLWIWLATFVVVAVCYGLLRAARKNYTRHISKMASLMTALLTQPAAADES